MNRNVEPTRRGRGKSQATLKLIAAAIRAAELLRPCTVRAVAYRLCHVDHIIPDMGKYSTVRVSEALVWARLQGKLDWEAIVDDGRKPERVSTWQSPQQILEATARDYRFDYWSLQPRRVEVWSEKATVRPTLAAVLDDYQITFRVMKGNTSWTCAHDVTVESNSSDRPFIALYVGDHDVSGAYMSDVDLRKRISECGGNVEIVRIAIRAEDKKQLPWFPAKPSNNLYKWYVERYGRKCFELDAMEPPVLRDRVESEIRARLDMRAWKRAKAIEAEQRAQLQRAIDSIATLARK